MPIFEYECPKCHNVEEFLLKKAARKKCSNCKAKMIRIMGTPSAHFKGTGFHATDYPKTKIGGKAGKILRQHGLEGG